ncbi:MAG: ATP synthase F1 subunit delta [Candidatus Kapaibacteriales bacterium]
MFEERISYRYAKAILETAIESNLEDILFKDFQYVDKVFSTSQLISMARKPIVPISKKKLIYKEIFTNKISDLSLASILFLTDKGRDHLVRSIITQYNKLYYINKGFLPVEIFFAVEVSEDIQNQIIKKIEENTNKKIVPKIIINPNIIGGFILKIDDWVYDASLKNKMNALYNELTKETILETNKG